MFMDVRGLIFLRCIRNVSENTEFMEGLEYSEEINKHQSWILHASENSKKCEESYESLDDTYLRHESPSRGTCNRIGLFSLSAGSSAI